MTDTVFRPKRRLRASLAFALVHLPLVWLAALRYVPYQYRSHTYPFMVALFLEDRNDESPAFRHP